MDKAYTKRYHYIDNIKIAACILVVIGHFWSSMVNNGILPKDAVFFYGNYGIYTFHVPLFFICSGFLYQKADRVHDLQSYGENIKWKFLNLGVPYFVFSTVTVILKHLAKDSVTTPAGALLDTLFVNPTAPYWYLYALFIFFLVIPCMKNIRQAYILTAVSLALILFYRIVKPSLPAPLAYICNWQLFFALGILLSFIKEAPMKKAAPYVMAVALPGALIVNYYYIALHRPRIFSLPTGLLFIVFTVFAAIRFCPDTLSRFSYRASEYFMPVFVLHTICSAPLRILLMHFGITHPLLHIAAGIIGGFVLPVIIYKICKKTKVLLFFFYPQKAIKLLKKRDTV